MLLWRISNHADLSGLGAERQGGRWHTSATDKRVVYLTEHPAVALVENLANLRGDSAYFAHHFQLLKIVAPDTITPTDLTTDQVTAIDADAIADTQSIGDAWLSSRSSALLRVPSIPSPESWNYLLNPLHPDAAQLRIDWAKSITYDRRLFHLGK